MGVLKFFSSEKCFPYAATLPAILLSSQDALTEVKEYSLDHLKAAQSQVNYEDKVLIK